MRNQKPVKSIVPEQKRKPGFPIAKNLWGAKILVGMLIIAIIGWNVAIAAFFGHFFGIAGFVTSIIVIVTVLLFAMAVCKSAGQESEMERQNDAYRNLYK